MKPAVVMALAVSLLIGAGTAHSAVIDASSAAERSRPAAAPLELPVLATSTQPISLVPADEIGPVEAELVDSTQTSLSVAEPGTIALLGLGLLGLGLARRRAARDKE